MDTLRKHRSQMQPYEMKEVERLVRAQNSWAIGPHARKRMGENEILVWELYDVLRRGYVIEANANNDLCLTFRKDYRQRSVCVVVNLETRWVVTVWTNDLGDQHSTLDTTKYKWNTNLCEALSCYATA